MDFELLGAAIRTLLKSVTAMCLTAILIQRGATWAEPIFWLVTFIFLATFIYTLTNTRRGAYRDDN